MDVSGPTFWRQGKTFGALHLALLTVVFAALFCAAASSASALTLGVSWSGRGNDVEEMGIVKASGSTVYRRQFIYAPGNPKANDDIVRAAAKNGLAILPFLVDGVSLPTESHLTEFKSWTESLVTRYGYGGSFWGSAEAEGAPYDPITVWEVWNEPNITGISEPSYGHFLGEIANTIHAAEKEPGQPTDILFGGLGAVNPPGTTSAITYLKAAWPSIASPYVTGIAIHPYDFNSESTTVANFKSAVKQFHEASVSLVGGSGMPLWITESGWPVGVYSFTEADQANNLTAAINFAKSEQATGNLNLKAFIWYDIRDNGPAGAWQSRCGLRTESGGYRTSWHAFLAETGAAEFPVAATATTLGAEVASFEANLPGFIDAHGLPTYYHYEWGRTGSYGNSTATIGAGEEERIQLVHETLYGLAPNETYHYRIVASNSLGTAYGEDKTFTTKTDVFFPDATDSNSLSYWAVDGTKGWGMTHTYSAPVAKGTHTTTFNHEGMQNVIFVDASRENRLTDFHWVSGTGWVQTPIASDPVAAGSSPAAVMVNGQPQIYFVDAATGNTMSVVGWTASGWSQARFYGDQIAANTSPAPIFINGTVEIYFVDASKSNIVALWGWGTTLAENYLWGDPVMAGSSPAVMVQNNEVQIYYADAAKGNTISVWGWGPSWLTFNTLYGDPVAEGTTPSVLDKAGEKQIYYTDAVKSHVIATWGWGSTLGQSFLYGTSAAATSSPSAVLNNGQVLVYLTDANKSNTVSVWEWGSTLNLNQLGGDPVGTGSSPSTR